MVAFSGAFGTVDGHSTVRNWRTTIETNPPIYRASNTFLGTGRLDGVVNWRGSFEQFSLKPVLFPGDSFTFIGYTAPSNGVRGASGNVFTGLAIVNEVTLTWNWRDNEPPTVMTSFESDGMYSLTTGAYGDLDPADPPQVCGLKIEIGNDVGSMQLWPNIARAELRFTTENPTYVNSGTRVTGPPAYCITKRFQGPLDWELNVLEDNDDCESVAVLGTSKRLHLYVDATTYWLLEWGKIAGFTDLTVDMETGRVIDQTVNIRKNGFVAGNAGSVVDPDLNVRWPNA